MFGPGRRPGPPVLSEVDASELSALDVACGTEGFLFESSRHVVGLDRNRAIPVTVDLGPGANLKHRRVTRRSTAWLYGAFRIVAASTADGEWVPPIWSSLPVIVVRDATGAAVSVQRMAYQLVRAG